MLPDTRAQLVTDVAALATGIAFGILTSQVADDLAEGVA